MDKKRLLLRIFFVSLILLMIALPAQAAEGVTVTLTPDQAELRVGDPVELTLQVTHPAGYQVLIPRLEQNWGPFEVWEQSQATTVDNGDGTATTRQTLTVTLFDVGTFETPALPVTISDGGDQVIEETAPPVSLTVNSVLTEGDTTLKDIRPQATMDVPSMLPLILTGGLVAGVALAAGWWLYRRWWGGGLPARVADNRPPFQVAFDELDRIDTLRLPEQGEFKRHYTLVTDALRRYLEQQFQVHAFDRTTSELKQSLRRSTMAEEHVVPFINFFVESDFVKFAKLVPDLESARGLTDSARKLVNLTRPVAELQQGESPPRPAEMSRPQKPVEVVQ